MYTEAINHDPAVTFFQTGSQIAGRPSFGSWIHYGLGSVNQNLPAFIVLVTPHKSDQPLYARLWGSGFLDARYQGIQFRSGKEPILYMSDPDGPCGSGRRALLDKLNVLNRIQFEKELDPEIESRIAQYEMAYRMQTSVPEVTDISKEPDSTFTISTDLTAASREPLPRNCLLARRLAERDVRFIQLYHQGWDQHDNLPAAIAVQAKRNRSSQRRAGQRSQTTRHVGGHAGDLGRRIWPHLLFARQADQAITTAATIIRAASPSGWRAAA
jgi:hypothetical protein